MTGVTRLLTASVVGHVHLQINLQPIFYRRFKFIYIKFVNNVILRDLLLWFHTEPSSEFHR